VEEHGEVALLGVRAALGVGAVIGPEVAVQDVDGHGVEPGRKARLGQVPVQGDHRVAVRAHRPF
jgi:hypothetical protein